MDLNDNLQPATGLDSDNQRHLDNQIDSETDNRTTQTTHIDYSAGPTLELSHHGEMTTTITGDVNHNESQGRITVGVGDMGPDKLAGVESLNPFGEDDPDEDGDDETGPVSANIHQGLPVGTEADNPVVAADRDAGKLATPEATPMEGKRQTTRLPHLNVTIRYKHSSKGEFFF